LANEQWTVINEQTSAARKKYAITWNINDETMTVSTDTEQRIVTIDHRI
jgi:hypothetical protein